MKKKLAITFDKNKIILLILSLICYELALYAIAPSTVRPSGKKEKLP